MQCPQTSVTLQLSAMSIPSSQKRASQQKRTLFTHLLASKAAACVHDWFNVIRPEAWIMETLAVARWLGAMTRLPVHDDG